MAEQTPPPAPLEFRRAGDFVSLYANNVQFETSLWDLKLIFGLLNQHEGKEVIQQHTSVNIPWLQAKLGSLYLQMILVAYEISNGKISIPPQLLPQVPPLGDNVTDPRAIEVIEAWRKILDQAATEM